MIRKLSYSKHFFVRICTFTIIITFFSAVYRSEKQYRHRLLFSYNLPLKTQKISDIQLELGFDALLESIRSGVNISPVDLNIDLHVSGSAVVDLSAVAPLSVIWDKYKRVNNKIKFIEFDNEHDTLDSAILSTIPHKV